MKGKEELNKEVAMKGFNENRKFGVEIELLHNGRNEIIEVLAEAGVRCVSEEYNHTRRSHWKIVYDRCKNRDKRP